MIISRTPYRLSLGGGGTDLPFYCSVKGAKFISCAIDHYIYVLVSNRPLDNNILIQTTNVQLVNKVSKIKHLYIKAVLEYFKIKSGIQVGTYSTIPTSGGIGLGSSSVLVVGLVNAISKYLGLNMSKRKIADIAFNIERVILKKEGGYQDQYISSLGGIKFFIVSRKGQVKYSDLKINNSIQNKLKKNFFLIYSNQQRKSEKIISSQKKKLINTIEAYDKIKDIGNRSKLPLEKGDILTLGSLFDEHWKIKKGISAQMTNNHLDVQYLTFKKNGAIGGKIIGAGGGGFFLMAVENNELKFKDFLKKNNYLILNWNFDFSGSTIIKS